MKAKINEFDKISRLGEGFCPRCKNHIVDFIRVPYMYPKRQPLKNTNFQFYFEQELKQREQNLERFLREQRGATYQRRRGKRTLI